MSPLVTLNSSKQQLIKLPGEQCFVCSSWKHQGLCPSQIAQRYCQGSPKEVISAKPLVPKEGDERLRFCPQTTGNA